MVKKEFSTVQSRPQKASSISLLPYMPFNPAWVEQSAAFIHPDPLVAVAAMKLLFAAWRGMPVGSIPSSHAYIASATGCSIDFVSKHYLDLTEGYELQENGRLQHVQLAKICTMMLDQYSTEIEAYALSVVMATQDPENIGLVSLNGLSKRVSRGKTALPKGFGYETCEQDLRGWCEQNGYPGEENQEWIMSKFIDYAKARDERQKDWAAAFRVWAGNEISRFRRLPPNPVGVGGAAGNAPQSRFMAMATKSSPFAALQRTAPTKGEQIINHNMRLMEDVPAGNDCRERSML